MMKKFSIILLLAMTLQLVNVQPVMGMADVGITEEKNIQISIGNGEKQVGYLECHDGNRGPEDFEIYGYQMYVLDSVNKKVLVYNNNEWSYNIYVEECRYPGLLCVDEDKVYVLDMNQDMIIQYDKYGNVQRNLIIPVNEYALYNAYFIKDMYIQNNKLCLEDIFGNIYVLEEDVFVSNLNGANILSSRNDEITVKGQECNISQFSKNTSLITIDKMNEEVLAIVNELYDENNVLRCNTNICLYDESGDLSKYHSIDLSDWYATPQNYIEIENDTAYIMECQMNNIVIRKMDFTNVSSSDDKPYGKLVETRTENNGIQVASQNAIYLCFDCAVTPERTIYRPWSATDLANYSCYTPW